MLITLLLLLFFFLIGFFFAYLTRIPQIRQFLLRNPKSRIGGLFFLAIFPFLASHVFFSRIGAVVEYEFLVSTFYNPYDPSYSPWIWLIQNESSILNELWIRNLLPFLPGGTCPFDPDVCKYGWLEGGSRDFGFSIPALIPAFITIGLGWLFTRKKNTCRQLTSSCTVPEQETRNHKHKGF